MKILFAGDIVGKPGREAMTHLLPELRREFGLDFVIANAENAAGGSGITAGDHIWKKRDIFEIINEERRILRPVNFPSGAPGSGYGLFKTKQGITIGVINAAGRVFMEALECPFKAVRSAQEALAKETSIIIVDMHAEATSEKVALGWYLDGKVSAVVGTHTHIQTADEKILPQGTAYITDAGMTGPYESVIGRRVEDVLEKFLTAIPVRLEVAENDVQLHGVVMDIDERTGKARSITRIQKKFKKDA
jgi:metallophosphoesterase (TIGR00282 family)